MDIEDLKNIEPIDRSSDSLTTLTNLTREMIRLEANLKEKEEEASLIKKDLSQLRDRTIPDFMSSLNLKEFTGSTGKKLKIVDSINASIPSQSAIFKEKDEFKRELLEQRRSKAFQFLRNTGNDSIIKNEIIIPLGKDSSEDFNKFEKFAQQEGIEFENQENVHAATLKKWVKEMREAGKDVDKDIFKNLVRVIGRS